MENVSRMIWNFRTFLVVGDFFLLREFPLARTPLGTLKIIFLQARVKWEKMYSPWLRSIKNTTQGKPSIIKIYSQAITRTEAKGLIKRLNSQTFLQFARLSGLNIPWTHSFNLRSRGFHVSFVYLARKLLGRKGWTKFVKPACGWSSSSSSSSSVIFPGHPFNPSHGWN